MTSLWAEHDLTEKVVDVLTNVTYANQEHHFGRPFVTAYQLAILLKQRYPETVERIGLPIGGRGTGPGETLARYVARELSRRIANHQLSDTIEGSFLSNEKLTIIAFDDEGTSIVSSSTDTQFDVSIFRLSPSRRT